jgi:hypothetical protein
VTERDRQLAAAIQNANPQTIHCRDYGHSWKPFWAEALPRKQGFLQELKCERCTTIRRRTLSRYGDILTKSYKYAADYKMPGVGRLTTEDKGQFRIASIMDTLGT